MAEASFTIRAVDATRAAFLNVQNSLAKMSDSADAAGRKMRKAFSIERGVTAAMVALGISMERIADKIAEKITGVSKEELAAQEKTLQLMEQEAATARSLAEAKRTSQKQLLALQLELEMTQGRIANNEGRTTDEVNRKIQDQTEANRLNLQILTLEEKVREKTSQHEDAIWKARNSLLQIGGTSARKQAGILSEIARLERQITEATGELDREENDRKRLRILELQGEAIGISVGAFRDYENAIQAIQQTEDDYAFSLMSQVEQQDAVTAAIARKAEQIEFLRERLGGASALENFEAATPAQVATMEALVQALGEYNTLLQKRVRLETDLERIARNAGDMIASSFEDAIFTGQKLSEVLRQLALDLMRMLFNQMVTQQLAASIGTFFGMPPLPGRAVGGSVTGRSAYVVGERGPEVFVPGTSGAIIPNNKLGAGGGGGGGSVNITYNIQSGVSRAELAPILESERKRLKAEIPDMVRRGGSYRAAFA